MPFALYNRLKTAVGRDASSDTVTQLIRDIHGVCVPFLATLERVALTSLVPGKEYFAFVRGNKRSRAVNTALFDGIGDPQDVLSNLSRAGIDGMPPEAVNNAIYKLTMTFCCTVDIQNTNDQQRPGTFFQHLVSHLISRRLGVQPHATLPVFSIDDPTGATRLPTDLIFDLGIKNVKFHVPVKTSTRERVIQVWAHQRVLDGAYGTGRFLGMLVCLAETKTASDALEVIEICLPDQWRIYQSFIAQLRRVYYLDIPAAYSTLDTEFPKIRVRNFGDFFSEVERIIEEG